MPPPRPEYRLTDYEETDNTQTFSLEQTQQKAFESLQNVLKCCVDGSPLSMLSSTEANDMFAIAEQINVDRDAKDENAAVGTGNVKRIGQGPEPSRSDNEDKKSFADYTVNIRRIEHILRYYIHEQALDPFTPKGLLRYAVKTFLLKLETSSNEEPAAFVRPHRLSTWDHNGQQYKIQPYLIVNAGGKQKILSVHKAIIKAHRGELQHTVFRIWIFDQTMYAKAIEASSRYPYMTDSAKEMMGWQVWEQTYDGNNDRSNCSAMAFECARILLKGANPDCRVALKDMRFQGMNFDSFEDFESFDYSPCFSAFILKSPQPLDRHKQLTGASSKLVKIAVQMTEESTNPFKVGKNLTLNLDQVYDKVGGKGEKDRRQKRDALKQVAQSFDLWAEFCLTVPEAKACSLTDRLKLMNKTDPAKSNEVVYDPVNYDPGNYDPGNYDPGNYAKQKAWNSD